MKTETIIHSNGSKWSEEKPDGIEKLIEVLKTETIEERFFFWINKKYLKKGEKSYFCCPISKGKFNEKNKSEDYVHFFGDFERLSHVFNIDTNDPEVIKKLTEAIKNNEGWKKYYEKNLKKGNEKI